jgi:hypothetical protein
MTKQSNKVASAASKEAAENWDDAPAPGSQNPETKQEPAPAEPTDKVSQDAAASTLKSAAANLPANPKTALVEVFKEVALVVGADKAKRLLVEQYGTENPEDLKASQLMDAIDDLYGAE